MSDCSFTWHVLEYPPKYCTYVSYNLQHYLWLLHATQNCCHLHTSPVYTAQPCTHLQHYSKPHTFIWYSPSQTRRHWWVRSVVWGTTCFCHECTSLSCDWKKQKAHATWIFSFFNSKPGANFNRFFFACCFLPEWGDRLIKHVSTAVHWVPFPTWQNCVAQMLL